MIEDVYFKEVAELVKKVTGSQDVLPYVFRIRQNNMRPGTFSTEKLSHTALPVAHVDRDNVTGENGMRELLADRAEELLKKGVRYAQVNVWRTIGEPVQRWPLCFVNHRSVPNWHYTTHMARVFPENDPRVAIRGEKTHDSVLKHDPKYVAVSAPIRNRPADFRYSYKYHYASALDVNETLVFSSFDSDITKVIPHGAFWDESSQEDAPTRRSIEVRCWVVFE